MKRFLKEVISFFVIYILFISICWLLRIDLDNVLGAHLDVVLFMFLFLLLYHFLNVSEQNKKEKKKGAVVVDPEIK